VDVLTPDQRRRCMATIKGRNTKPEIVLRKALFSLGLRYQLHQKRLPGTPDLVFPKHRAVVFIHGCFWHGHGCKLFVVPATNREFWVNKIGGNGSRDKKVICALKALGWRVMTVWECTIRGRDGLPVVEVAGKISRWLHTRKPMGELPGRPAVS
jgi:DNA mismatch endonuclease (patch repair protein)